MATGKKTGGRQSGTPNKLTKELRSVLKGIVNKEIEGLPERLKELDTEKRIEMLVKLMPYVLPKVEAINAKEGEPLDYSLDTY